MALVGIVGGVILLCIIAALWVTGSTMSRQFNLRRQRQGCGPSGAAPARARS
jgi:hypothetical protein